MQSGKGITCLSVFDGISCGQIALNRAGIKYDNYFASEIDKPAIKVTMANYPNTIQIGDVTQVKGADLPKIDMLIGGSPCFVAGTKVITKNAIKNIEDVLVGDYVLTHTNTFQKVLKIGAKHSDTIELKAQGMKPTKTTHEHPYYVRSMHREWDNDNRTSYRKFSDPYWKSAGELVKGDFIGMPRLNTNENIYNLTHEECWVIGRYIADGHTRKDYRTTENRPNDRHWQLILSIGTHKLDTLKNNVKELNYSAYPHTKSVTRVVFSNKRLVEIVESECGCGAENKHISMNLLNLPVDLLKSLLDGYLCGDGSNQNGIYSANSVSENLIMTINLAILKVYGVNSSYDYTKRPDTYIIEGRTVNQKDTYTTSFRLDMKVQSHAKLIDDIMWLPIKSAVETDSNYVYNLEVEHDNSYTANNIIVHNCQGFSFAGKQLNFNDPRSKLFFEYVRLLRECNPKYFLLENVKMKKEFQDVITEHLGVSPVKINSSLVSAQNRERLYWTNIPINTTPEDKGLTLKDVISDVTHHKITIKHPETIRRTKNYAQYDQTLKGHGSQDQRFFYFNGKSGCITTSRSSIPKVEYGDEIILLLPEEVEKLQTVPTGYTSIVKTQDRYAMLGNGWTVDVIAHIFKGLKEAEQANQPY